MIVLKGKKPPWVASGAALTRPILKSLSRKDEFICACEEQFRPVCQELPFYAAYEGMQYCVLHFPGQEKATDPRFLRAIERKLEDRDFRFGGVYLPGSFDFESCVFESRTDFTEATFEDHVNFAKAVFEEEATFRNATYKKGADFTGASFTKDANFLGAIFEMDEEDVTLDQTATFDRVTFQQDAIFLFAKFGRRARFVEATFKGEADFSLATFMWVWFERATFEGEAGFGAAKFCEQANLDGINTKAGITFSGLDTFRPQTRVYLREARIEQPERCSFRTIRLRPGWFVSVDPGSFDFVNVQWHGLPKGPRGDLIEEDLGALQLPGHQKSDGLGMLSKTYHGLSANAEESRRYMEAAEFRYWAMDAERRRIGGGRFSPWSLTWWYWILSGYGERPVRSLLWLGVMLVGFAALYMLLGFTAVPGTSSPSVLQTGWQAVVYSLGVMTRQSSKLAASEPVMLQTLVFLEGILGPLQIGLMALALRRKFMR